MNFDQAWERRIEIAVDEHGLKVPFISAEDFIANKLAAARPQDFADVAAVRRAREVNLKPGDAKSTDGKNGEPQ